MKRKILSVLRGHYSHDLLRVLGEESEGRKRRRRRRMMSKRTAWGRMMRMKKGRERWKMMREIVMWRRVIC
jgi:hypothetical protein